MSAVRGGGATRARPGAGGAAGQRSCGQHSAADQQSAQVRAHGGRLLGELWCAYGGYVILMTWKDGEEKLISSM